jgi:hypothetical protein
MRDKRKAKSCPHGQTTFRGPPESPFPQGEDPSLEIDREDLRDRMIGDDHVFLETHGIRWLFKALSVLAKFERLHKRPLVGSESSIGHKHLIS